MSEVKPVIKTAEQRYDEIKGSETFEDRQSLCVMNECLEAEAKELRAALEALQAENAKLREENEKYQKLFDEIEQHKKALKLCRKI